MYEMRGAMELSLSHQSITQRVPMKGKCYSQESRKGTDSETYRVKQVWAECDDNRTGFPLMLHSTNRVPTLNRQKEGIGR
jgi:hypothetical protein